jgi:phenylpyruvate tautomerase PptA (4-oxalocrotonate tautomerase family)
MPLVRISHVDGKPPEFALALSQGVHKAMVDAFGFPHDDHFQVVTDHAAYRGVIGPKAFLGIAHTPELVIIQITCAEGRTVEQKKALYAGIVDRLSQIPDIRREDVIINLIETKRENWSFGNGQASFA